MRTESRSRVRLTENVLASLCICLSVACMTSMAIGSGFRLRQVWRGYNETSGRIIECGLDLLDSINAHRCTRQSCQLNQTETRNIADRNGSMTQSNAPSTAASETSIQDTLNTTTGSTLAPSPNSTAEPEVSLNMLCRVAGLTDAEVHTMTGYAGHCNMDLWTAVGMQFQFAVLIIIAVNVIVSLMIISQMCNLFAKKLLLAFCCVSLNACAMCNYFHSSCPAYADATIATMTQQLFQDHKYAHLSTGEYDFAVHCSVDSFELAALLAQLASITCLLHLIIVSYERVCFDVPPLQQVAGPRKSSASSASDKPDSLTMPSKKSSEKTDSNKSDSLISDHENPIANPYAFDQSHECVKLLKTEPEKSILISTSLSSPKTDSDKRVKFDEVELEDVCFMPKEHESRVGKWYKEEMHFKYEEPSTSVSSVSRSRRTRKTAPDSEKKKATAGVDSPPANIFGKVLSSLRLKVYKNKKKAGPK